MELRTGLSFRHVNAVYQFPVFEHASRLGLLAKSRAPDIYLIANGCYDCLVLILFSWVIA